LGHEIVGEIVAFGSKPPSPDITGQPLAIGDRIVWGIATSCGECYYCNRSLPQKCERGFKYGHAPFRADRGSFGGLAEHCLLVAGTQVLRLPAAISLGAACPLSCATSTIAAAIRIIGMKPGERVLIAGAGMLGLTACAWSHTLGAEKVVCVDPIPERRQLALRFGATDSAPPDEVADRVRTATEGYGFDCAIECTGNNRSSQNVLDHVRLGGRIGLVGAVYPSDPVPIVWERIVRRQIALFGIHNYAPQDLVSAVAFMEQAHATYPFADLVRHWFALGEMEEAVVAAQHPANIRIAVTPHGEPRSL
jgi:alcohol dehydrogenase